MISTQLDMKDTTLSNGVNVEKTTSGEHFCPAALASDSAIGGQVFARPHNEAVIRISSYYFKIASMQKRQINLLGGIK